MLFSNLKLHLTTTRSSTFSGFKLAVLWVTTLPATEKTRSDLDEAAGTGKTTLSLARRGNCVSWCFPHPSWSTEDSSSDNSWKDFVLQFVGGFELFLLLLHHVCELLLVVCLKEVSQGFGGALANLDDQGWTWDDEYLLALIYACHLWLGFTCTEDTLQWHHQYCLQSISKLWMPLSSEQHCSFGWEAWLSVEEMNM